MAPSLTRTGQELYDALAPLAAEDERYGWPLATYCGGLAAMIDELADLSREGDDGEPGWAVVMDPNAAPARFLPYLGQFNGVRVPIALPAPAQRQRIRETDGFRRGTPAALKGAAKQFLGGNQTVFITERHGSPYKVTVTVYTAECPDPAATEAAVREQKPAGLVLTFALTTGGDFNTLRDTHATFAVVASTFASFDAARANPAQQ